MLQIFMVLGEILYVVYSGFFKGIWNILYCDLKLTDL